MKALISRAETSRLEALAGCNIQYDVDDPRLDLITRLASTTCQAPVAFIAFVEAEWVRCKSVTGISLAPLARANEFCTFAVAAPHKLTVIGDARHDRRFEHHPLVCGAPHLRSFAGAPILDPKGFAVGVLAVMHYQPHYFSDAHSLLLGALAAEISALLALCETVHRLEGELSEHLRYERRLEAAQRQWRRTSGLWKLAATTDGLTMLANRGAFDSRLDEEIERVNRRAAPLSLLIIDIDGFKPYNDSYGHPAGDEALQAVAQQLQQTIRTIDFVARIGGDEFAVILPGTDLSGATAVAERCRAAIEQRPWPQATVHVSIGAAQYAGPSMDAAVLVCAADSALYSAKFDGRNRVVAYPGAMTHSEATPASARRRPAPNAANVH